uniref:Fatty acid desaturase domain-containing protein n=1 Tax=Phlebotomus papatasi TaxID=29031 RepID=A0A1B0GM39_PHLPP
MGHYVDGSRDKGIPEHCSHEPGVLPRLTPYEYRNKLSLVAFVLYVVSGLGITAGAHRLWAHRAYKAKLPLRIILVIFNTIAFQDCAMHWARDHRVHHKFSETDADPHNATRGFFFSHIGWLLCRKHPEVIAKGRNLDISDLKADPVLRFQKK